MKRRGHPQRRLHFGMTTTRMLASERFVTSRRGRRAMCIPARKGSEKNSGLIRGRIIQCDQTGM